MLPIPVRHLAVRADAQSVAGAEVAVLPDTVQVRFHVRGGHIPMSTRAELVEHVFQLPEVAAVHALQASVPLGDVELLTALRHRCSSMQTRAAGSTCLVDGVLAPPAR